MFRNLAIKSFYMSKRFAGHSKWANIRHIKGAKDAERSLLFSKLARQIKIAVVEGGSLDPDKNLQLSQIISQCKRCNMPVATIQNVLKSCTSDKSNLMLYIVPIKGPGNSLLLCEIYTNNLHHVKNVMASQLKKTGSKFIEGQSGLHAFEEKGFIQVENSSLFSKSKEEQMELATEHAIECNAEDVVSLDDKVLLFITSKQSFPKTQELLEQNGYKILDASIDFVPLSETSLDEIDFPIYEKLIKRLETIPEIVRVFDNVSSS
ncbi:translational activator of cytochrome c oxidase 1-like [Euwallacea fornicatus]|uniref:translational activator of cytochrome c oxidase 1-like n=1 Tax=Euwallacea fornicatus TaxID=995702 RepID=UPI00338DE490